MYLFITCLCQYTVEMNHTTRWKTIKIAKHERSYIYLYTQNVAYRCLIGK